MAHFLIIYYNINFLHGINTVEQTLCIFLELFVVNQLESRTLKGNYFSNIFKFCLLSITYTHSLLRSNHACVRVRTIIL